MAAACQMCIRDRDFPVQLVGVESAAERQRDGMLGQHVQAADRRRPRLDLAARDRLAGGGVLDQFERLGRHADHVAGLSRPVPGAAGALQEARHALGAADLQDLVPVSYTHLDVYKRQVYGRLLRRMARPRAMRWAAVLQLLGIAGLAWPALGWGPPAAAGVLVVLYFLLYTCLLYTSRCV